MRKSLLISLLALFAYGCNQPSSIKEIRFKYTDKDVDVHIPVSCDGLDYSFPILHELIVSDPIFLAQLEEYLKELTPCDKEIGADVRIKGFIDYGQKVDTLCLGEYFDVVYNNQMMNDHKELLDLVKSKLYKE
jgi:hypothetical protein